MSYKNMNILIKLYICKSQVRNVHDIMNTQFLPMLCANYFCTPLCKNHPYIFEKYYQTNYGSFMDISIPILVNKTELLKNKIHLNYITRLFYHKKKLAKYLERNISYDLYNFFYKHPHISMKSTSLKYVHVNTL